MSTDSVSSRIARQATTIAFLCCLYGGWVWIGRAAEPDQASWIACYAVAAVSMLGCRAYLGGVGLRVRTRRLVGAARGSIATLPIRSTARRAAPVAVAVLMVTSVAPSVAPVGAQSLEQSNASLTQADQVETEDALIVGYEFDGAVRSIDRATGNQNWEYTVSGGVVEVSLSPDEKTVYAASLNGNVYALNATDGSEKWVFSGHTDEVNGVVASPDGETVYSASDDASVRAIDAETGTENWAFSGHSSDVKDVAVSPDGKTLFSVSYDNTVKSVNVATQTVNWTVQKSDSFNRVVVTNDGSTVYAANFNNNLYQITTSDGAVTNQMAFDNTLRDIELSPDEGTIFVGGDSGNLSAVDVETWQIDWTDSFSSNVHSIWVASPDSIYHSGTSSSDNYIRELATADGSELTYLNIPDGIARSVTGGYVYPQSGSGSGDPDINGTVSTTSNDGVANSTVQLTISKEPSIPQADSQLDELSNPIPSAFEQQIRNGFDLLGDGGFLESRDGQYAAIYSTADLGLTYQAEADLSTPKITNVEPGEEQAIILADTTADCGLFGISTNEYNGQIPGCVQPEGNVTIEKLSGTGDVVATDTVSVAEAGNYQDFEGVTDVHYAPYTFSEGVYRVSAGDDGLSYLVKAGNPTPDFNRFAETVENTRTEQAQNMRDAISQDLLEVRTVTTNETGHWNASLPDNAKLVTVSARKAPGVDVDPANLTYENMSTAYNAEDSPNASVYLPSRTKRVSPPAQNVDLTLREVAFPSFADIDKLQTRLEELRNRLTNLSMDDLPQQMLQRLETQTRNDIAPAWQSLRGTITNFEPAREAYLEISDRDSVPTADELSKDELLTAIRNGNVALTRVSSTGQLIETGEETTEDAISKTWELAGIPLEEANVSVIADYSNGTSRVVDDELIETDSTIAGTQTISVQEFPMGETDPEQVSFRLRVAGNNELAETTSSILNPTFGGEVPSIDAVEVTSLQPGPSDRVTVEIHPDDQSTFREVTNMTVRGPDGSTIETSNISDGTTASFTTNGAGTHSIRFSVESTNGGTFTDVVQISAADSDETLRPSIYAHSGPLGTYALVGDGFESGDVETTSTGSLEVVGVLGADQDVPNTADVFLEGVDVGTESTTTVRVVRGESRQSVRANVPLVVHTPMLNSPDDSRSYKTLVRANSNPITWSGDTRFGVVEMDDDGASIKAYTADDGTLTLSLDNTPTWGERQSFWLDTNYPWLPFVGTTVTTPPLLAGLFVFTRRRSES